MCDGCGPEFGSGPRAAELDSYELLIFYVFWHTKILASGRTEDEEVGAAPGLDKKNCKCPNDRIAPGSVFSSCIAYCIASGSLFHSTNPSLVGR